MCKSKTEATVLDMCMGESVFKKARSSKQKSKNLKLTPSNNPFKYKDFVVPIWELSKVSKNEIIEFDCRSTHEVKPPIWMDHENDVLYQIFVEVSGQDVKFMRIWLDMFVKMHEKSFEQRGKDYFRSKGLMFSCWAESILDNRKADVMGLYSLCMLTEVHAWIHLHNDQTWSMLADDKLNHDTAMERCEIHLTDLG